MRTNAKIVCGVLLTCLLGGTMSAQEKSGVFIGVNAGVSLLHAENYGRIATGGNLNDSAAGASFASMANLGYDGDSVGISVAAGASVGYSHFFGSVFGLRGFLGYEYLGSRKIANIPAAASAIGLPTGSASISFHEVTANFDILLNFINTQSASVGVFVGFGVGYNIATLDNSSIKDFFQSKFDYSGLVLPIRVGISTTFAEKHRIEITGKIATFATKYMAKESNIQHTTLTTMGVTNLYSTDDGVGINPYTITLGYSYIF